MQPDRAVKRSLGRPLGSHNRPPATPTDRMVDALMIWRVGLDRPDAVREVLRLSGFIPVQIDALSENAVAAARKRRPGRRCP